MAVVAKLTASDIGRLASKIRAMRDRLDSNLRETGRGIAQMMLSLVTKKFAAAARGNPPKEWPPLSLLTRFIRAHRASAPNKKARMLNDRGNLRDANFMFVNGAGTEFGIGNSASYAGLHQFGGTSQPSTVQIAAFKRSNPGGAGTHRVGPFTMRLKGHKVEARPFMPTEEEYMPFVVRGLRAYAKKSRGDLG